MKIKPKSCSCQQCMRGKHTKTGHFLMNKDERSNRRAVKTDLDKFRGVSYNMVVVDELEDLVINTVPQGNYYD